MTISASLPAHRSIEANQIPAKQVAFDIDGVVADTMTLFVEIARQDFAVDHLRYEDIVSYSLHECLGIEESVLDAITQKLLDGDYSQPLYPINGAPEVLARLGQYFPPLLFVTARPYVGPIENWIHEMLSIPAADIEIVPTGSFEAKIDVLKAKGITFFVEDRLETCEILNEAGITPILFKQPWNRDNQNFTEVETWHDLERLIDFNHTPLPD
jgi:uncharacterized HAD superfamily protein